MVDKKLNIKYVNDNLLKLLQYDLSEIERRPILDFMDEKNKNLLRKQWKRRQAGEQKPYELTLPDQGWSRGSYDDLPETVFLTRTGPLPAPLSLVVDLRQRKQQETQALQTQKLEAIGQLARRHCS